MSYWKDFSYVDAQYENPLTKQRSRWERVRVGDVHRRIVAKAKGGICLASIQRFKDATSLRDLAREQAEEELRKHPPKKNGHDHEEEARLAREHEADALPAQQAHYHGLYFDFDADPVKLGCTHAEALVRSQADARTLVGWFLRTFEDLEHPHVQVWFSGRKGFHVVVRPEPFGIKPHNHLTYMVKAIAGELADALTLPTLDRSVYTVARLWRIPNTQHAGSGLYKIELTVDELQTWTPAQILERAATPRGLDQNDPEAMPESNLFGPETYKDLGPDPTAVAWFLARYQAYDAYRDLKKLSPKRSIVRSEDAEDFPICVNDLLTNGPKPGGPNRNRVILPIAGFFHDAALDKKEALRQLDGWTRTFYPDPNGMADRLNNGRSVVESAYRGQVKFSCRFIRSLSGSGEKGQVACCGESKCPWISEPADQEPAQVPEIHLSEASKGCYVNTKIKTAVHIAAVAGRPYELPIKGRVLCTPDMDAPICERCSNRQEEGCGNGKMEFTFGAQDRHVLDIVNVPDHIRKATIRSKLGITKECQRHKIEVLESSNIEELQIIPMVDYAHAYQVEHTEDEDDAELAKSSRHVVRSAYYLGHGIEANKKYVIEATVFGHPKDQRVCFLFDTLTAAQNDIDQFRMTDELREKLRIFQVQPGQKVLAKLLEIHKDFTANVHQIGGRTDLSIAVDLCYHAVIGFKFAGQWINKGWFELLVIGDSAAGKSSLIERMMRHYGLGELIGGEDAKRTGLVYASIQMQGQWILRWGKVPQNDRRLLVIDEFAGIPPDEVGRMTQLRSEGRARGGGVNQDYETWARTRLIFLTNPRNNRGQMANFNYGVQAVVDLFNEAQDIRRVDMAIVVDRDEVDASIINRRWDQADQPHEYTADLCRNLVLWAWSREPHQVEWGPGAEDLLLAKADQLGDTYECDIPLAERADLRLKLARISAAAAARVFSTDADAKKLIVGIPHVEFAANFMDTTYRKQSMSYFEYARKYKQDNHYSNDKLELMTKTLKDFAESNNIIATLLDIDVIVKTMFADMVNLEVEDFRTLWKFLVGNRLLHKGPKGYRKTSAFTKYLKGLGVGMSGYAPGLPVGFEEMMPRRTPGNGVPSNGVPGNGVPSNGVHRGMEEFLDDLPVRDGRAGDPPPF